MCAHRVVRSARRRGWQRNVSWQFSSALLLLLVTPLVQGCTGLSAPPRTGLDPSDPAVRLPVTSYRTVTGGYQSRRPVDPAPWRERNDGVAPAPKR